LTFGTGHAEVGEIRIAQQYGINYLPLMVMEDGHLIEAQARQLGLGDLKVVWSKMSSGAAMNDALLSGNLDIASGGVGPIVVLWAKTSALPAAERVKGIAALDSMPVVLNTRNPRVKSITDFTDTDKIALPAVKVSIQAVTLQMAVAKAFGDEHYAKLDPITVSMSHPDGMIALLSGRSEVDAHFTGPPFSELELQHPGITTVVHSYKVLGGMTTSTLAWTTARFHDENPKAYQAFLAALKQAVAIIDKDKRAAAELYLRMTKGKESVATMQSILSDPDIEYTLTPMNVLKYAAFMHKVGSIKVEPRSWTEMFFPEIHELHGS
ncbi:MAG TPA: ABC transporter substrate-binding protein, partial [Casimicrobiaceae bacterium]|nr:ABC transporter substrate-binding protein [Casimicrobiaceae bacterium]